MGFPPVPPPSSSSSAHHPIPCQVVPLFDLRIFSFFLPGTGTERTAIPQLPSTSDCGGGPGRTGDHVTFAQIAWVGLSPSLWERQEEEDMTIDRYAATAAV